MEEANGKNGLPVPERYEELSEKTVAGIRRAFPGAQGMVLRLNEIDLKRGCGMLNEPSPGRTRCVWTESGRRITIWQDPHGGRGATCSKTLDPLADQEAR